MKADVKIAIDCGRWPFDRDEERVLESLGQIFTNAMQRCPAVKAARSEFEAAAEIAAARAIAEALPITMNELIGLLNGTHEVRAKLAS